MTGVAYTPTRPAPTSASTPSAASCLTPPAPVVAHVAPLSMVSETPRNGRCAARITDKVGLELHLDGTGERGESETIIDDSAIRVVRLTGPDGAIVDAEPDYQAVREYRWNDYTPTAVAHSTEGGDATALYDSLRAVGVGSGDDDTDVRDDARAPSCAETPPADTAGSIPAHDSQTLRWVGLNGRVTKMTNARGEHQGYCERYPMDDSARCYVHQPGPGAPNPEVSAITHGLYAQRTNFYEQLADRDKRFVESLVDSWLEQSDYTTDNIGVVNELYRCAIDQLRAWSGIDEFVDGTTYAGLVTEQQVFDESSGELQTIEDEHPANLPYSRLDRDIQSKLKNLGIYDDADSKQAEATESLAQALSGMTDD